MMFHLCLKLFSSVRNDFPAVNLNPSSAFLMALCMYIPQARVQKIFPGGGPTLSKIESVWRLTVEVLKYEK